MGKRFVRLAGCEDGTDVGDGGSARGLPHVRLSDGTIRLAELHWYEASGIGKKEFKIKRYLE